MSARGDDLFARAASLEGVPSALAAARDGVDSLLRDRGLRQTTTSVTAEALLRGAVSSARLSGSVSPEDDVRHGTGDDVASAAARLNAGLLALVPVLGRSPLEAFARLHMLAAAGRVPDEQLGRPRPEPGASQTLRTLAALLLGPTAAPAIAVAAMAHAEIAVTRPFGSANGLVARALERLVLVSRGVDPASVLVPEAGHEELARGYRDALGGYGLGTALGLRGWLLHSCLALGVGVARSPLRGPEAGAGSAAP